MDYKELAMELLPKLFMFRKAHPQKKISESMRGEAFVIQYVSACGGEVLPGEISNEMDISSARIAAALNSLENKGMITRRIDTSDRRRILVELTEAGKEIAMKHQQTVVEETAEMLSLLGEQDAREYVRITGRLADMLSKK